MKVFKEDLQKAYDEYEATKKLARERYIERNKKASIESIVTNGNKTIKVKRIFLGYDGMDIWYSGKLLTKKLDERQDGKEITVFGSSTNFKVIKGV